MSDIDPTELSVAGRRSLSEKFGPDGPDAPLLPPHVKPEREGLPPGYRMRADSHYVEQLSSRRADRMETRAGTPASEAGEADAPTDARDWRSERVLAQLGEEIAAMGSVAALVAADGASLTRRTGVDLLRAQAWRASWLLRTHAMFDAATKPQVRPRPLGLLLEHIRQGMAPECRLAGIGLQMHASDWNTSVLVDESAIAAGVTGAVIALLGLIGHTDGAIIRVSAEASAGELRAIDVVQDDVTGAPGLGLRFFDLSWADRPGGVAAAIGALSARAAAQQHGGTATLVLGDRRGATVRLSFTRTH